MLNLAFLLDITGSMSCELEGVKETVVRLMQTAFTVHQHDGLTVTLVTFTEDHRGCYVTSDSFTDGLAAAKFVNAIRLCVPPNMPTVNASGGDGPENHKAALAELLRLDPELPTIAFLITDAIPHLYDQRSAESGHEIRLLQAKHGIDDPDLFGLLDRLEQRFGDKLILNVIKYYQTTDHALFGAMAKRLRGVLVTPHQRTPEHLANGLMAIFSRLFASLAQTPGAPVNRPVSNEEARALDAFAFYDLDNVNVPEKESGRYRIPTPVVGCTDTLLFQLIERATVIVGSRFVKRAITAHLANEQVELVLVLAKGLTGSIPVDEAVTRAELLLSKIRTHLPDENRSQFKLQVGELRGIIENLALAAGAQPTDELSTAVSAITLMSIEETAAEIDLEGHDAAVARDPYESLLVMASLFLGHLSVLELPTRLGVVDFMDSWSAAIHKVSNDVVSAADFLRLVGSEAGGVVGLSNRDRAYNFLQLVADPGDVLGSELVRVASGTQVLDLLTALLAGAPPGFFAPNMFRGTLSACLLTLLCPPADEPLSEFQWGLVAKLVHTSRLIIASNPTTLVLEPESAMGKLLFRLLRWTRDADEDVEERGLREFLEELAAARAQKFAKHNAPAFMRLIERMVAYEHAPEVVDVFAPHPLLDADGLPFDGPAAVAFIAESKFCRAFEQVSANVLRAVYHGRRAPSLTQVWPMYTEDLPKLLLLHKRSARYTLAPVDDDGNAMVEAPREWQRDPLILAEALESPVFARRALLLVRVKYEAFIRELRGRRNDQIQEGRWQAIVALMRAPMEEFVTQLGTVVQSSSRREHKLLLDAFRLLGSELSLMAYEAKLEVVITGRRVDEAKGRERIVFNRGNLHPHPDRHVPMSEAFKSRLRRLRHEFGWSLAHRYRESGLPNHSNHSNSNPSAWAKKRSLEAVTFWDAGECCC